MHCRKCHLCELWSKEAEEKKQKEREKQQHVIVTENILFKGFTQKVLEIITRNSPASLIVALHGILLREEFHVLRNLCNSMQFGIFVEDSELLDYFRS